MAGAGTPVLSEAWNVSGLTADESRTLTATVPAASNAVWFAGAVISIGLVGLPGSVPFEITNAHPELTKASDATSANHRAR